jgi:hypothetical protein
VVPSPVTDSNGKVLGWTLDDDSTLTPSLTGTVMDINGLEVALEMNSSGFIDSLDQLGGASAFYSDINCTGTVYMEYEPDYRSVTTPPMVISAVLDEVPNANVLQNAWVSNGFLYYPVPPYSTVGTESVIEYPTFNADGSVGGDCSNVSQDIYGGNFGTVNLNELGYTAPFSGVPVGTIPAPSPISPVPISTPTATLQRRS